MSVQKRTTRAGTTRWVARWRDDSGTQCSKSFGTRRAAKEHLATVEVSRARGTLPKANSVTVTQLVDYYLQARILSESSVRSFKNLQNVQLGPLAGRKAREVTREDIDRWARQLRAGRPWRGEGDTGLADSTVTDMLMKLGAVFRHGMEYQLVGANPVRVEALDTRVEPDVIPSAAEIARIIARIESGGYRVRDRYTRGPSPEMAAFFTTLARTGMRFSELAGLIVSEIDLDAGLIRVRKQLARGRVERVKLKTARSRRDIPIPTDLIPILIERTTGRAGGDWVFTSPSGRPVAVSTASAVIHGATRHEGLDHVHAHSFRHAYASQLLTAGVPVQDAATVLGHSPSQLLKTYAHVLDGSAQRVRDALGCGIFEGSLAMDPARDRG